MTVSSSVRGRSLDLAGALTATSGLSSLIYAFPEVPDSG
jgi:hypothetical protein